MGGLVREDTGQGSGHPVLASTCSPGSSPLLRNPTSPSAPSRPSPAAVPEELFGPLSMRALEEDQYVRQTAGYLPEATVAFVDEIFKANSAILNTLLTILNERLFDNGATRTRVPLLCLVSSCSEGAVLR